MIKVYQTRTGNNGNCFNACLASILEIGIKVIPKTEFTNEGSRWIAKYHEFLKPFNLSLHWCDPIGSNRKISGYAIGCFHTVDKKCRHAVVCYNGRKVHDPSPNHPQKSKLGKLDYWVVLTVLDPSK